MYQIGSNRRKGIESVDKVKPEIRQEVLSIQPAKNNSHKAPGIETGEDLAPALKYNTEDDEAVKVEDKEHVYTTEYEPDTGTNDTKEYVEKDEKTENNETKETRENEDEVETRGEKRTGLLTMTQPPDESPRNCDLGNDTKISAKKNVTWIKLQ